MKPLAAKGALDPRLSPDGKLVSYVKDWDLYVLDLATGKERRLTTGGSERLTHGLAEFVAQEEMGRYDGAWWSPDGKLLAFEEADTRLVETFSLGDPAHPEAGVQQLPYPRPGKSNAKVRVGLVPAAGGKTSWVKWDAERYPYLTQVKWPGRGALTLYVMDRAQQHAQLLAVDPKTGATRRAARGAGPGVAQPPVRRGRPSCKPLPLWLPDGSAFFWVTERNGAPEAEIRGSDGKRLGSWVRPDQQLVRILGYDATEHALYYQASPESPDLVVMRVRDGGNPERVVGQIGERVIVSGMLAEDGPTRLVSIETPTSFAEWSVFDRGGRFVGRLPSVRATPLRTPAPEYRKLGPQGFWSYVLRPRDARPGQKLPTIVSIYGGPHANHVQSSARALLSEQWLADQGFLVVGFDNRGTPRRGRDWERAIRGDLAGPMLEDQVAALQLLAQQVPELDLARVGITGWSFGGFASALAVLKRPGRLPGGGGRRAGDRLAQLRHLLHRAVPRAAGRPGGRLREERPAAARRVAPASAPARARDDRRQRVLPPLAPAVRPAVPGRPGAPVPAAERVHAHGRGPGDAGVALAAGGRVLPVAARRGRAPLTERPGTVGVRARASPGQRCEGRLRPLDGPDVLGLQPLRAAGHVELDLLTLGEGTEPVALNRGVVTEDVLTSAVLGDEAEALRIVEPLHGTGSHASRFAVLASAGSAARSPVPGAEDEKFCADANQGSSIPDTVRRSATLTRRVSTEVSNTSDGTSDVPSGPDGGVKHL